MATATKTAKKTMTPQQKGEEWLKANHAQEGLFIITNIFPTKKINTKNGERVQFSISAVEVKKGEKFDINNSIYMSCLVNPENEARMKEMQSLSKHRYSITYRDSESEYKGTKHVFHNIIKTFPKYKQN